MAEYNIKLKVYGKGEHICKKCFHYAFCIYQRGNNPIIECSHFVDQSKEKGHGKWLLANDGDGKVCSICGTDYCDLVLPVLEWNFCPNCGAKMESEGEE